MESKALGRFTVRLHPSITSDGRFGRCWAHIYEHKDDGVRYAALRLLVRRYGSDEEAAKAMALSEACRWLSENEGRIQRGKLYKIVIAVDIQNQTVRQKSYKECKLDESCVE